jgi:hypothetical protein
MSHAAFRPDGKLTRAFRFIRGTVFVASAVGALFFLASCGNKQASGSHATVLMRDGSALTGTVTATSTFRQGTSQALSKSRSATAEIPTRRAQRFPRGPGSLPATFWPVARDLLRAPRFIYLRGITRRGRSLSFEFPALYFMLNG